MGLFDFDPNRAGYTYADVQRRRAMAEALQQGLAQARPQTFADGLGSVGTAIASIISGRKASQSEKLREAEGNKRFAEALGTIPAPAYPTMDAAPAMDYTAASGDPLAAGIVETAQAIGADPLDLATAISYETAGTFDPAKAGPTTQWGQHRGLIQFGEPQAKQYGVNWSDPIGSQLGANGAIARYFRDRGFKPGMSGLDLYSTINAGAPGRYSASDADNGGAPGDVADKWLRQMEPHRQKAAALLGGGEGQAMTFSPPLSSGQAFPAYSPPAVNVALLRAVQDPYLTPEQKQILSGVYAQQQALQITPYQAWQMQQDQNRMAMEQARFGLEMRQAGQVKPVEINGQLVNPQTGEVIGDYRTPEQHGVGGTEYGLTPQYGVDAQGNPVLIQIGKDGTATQTAMPPDVTFQKEPIRLDAGTHWVLLDPITRQPVGQVQKDLSEAEAQKAAGAAQGKAQADAQAGLSTAVAKADQAITLLEGIRDDPALPGITGMVQGRMPPMTQAGTDLNVRIEQAQGQVFLEAFQTLKGGGAITEIEGKKAEQAIARMNRAQSTPAYRAALNELIEVIRGGRERAVQKAGGAAPAPDGWQDMGNGVRIREKR